MIKTTNFIISKKLAEIGFRAECSYFYFHSDNNNYEASSLEEFGYNEINDCDIEDKYYPAYDLEILLNALPRAISVMQEIYPIGFHLNIDLNENAQTFSYIEDDLLLLQEHHEEAFVIKTQDESLADTAGRLIILLHNKNLIKF